MGLTRRAFVLSGACAGAKVALARGMKPASMWASDSERAELAPYLTGMRIAATTSTSYRAYRSKAVQNPDVTTWVQVDLNKILPIQSVQLFPASERFYPGRDQFYGGEGFPLRSRITASEDLAFTTLQGVADLTHSDFPDPGDNITQYAAHDCRARFVRLTATALRPVKAASTDGLPEGEEAPNLPDYTLMLAKMAIIQRRGCGRGLPGLSRRKEGNPALMSQSSRPARQDGEEIRYDKPGAVT
jgi:hypothetical protein